MEQTTFKETTWVWQLQQFWQQTSEWWEARTNLDPNLDLPEPPDWQPSEAVLRVLFWGVVLVAATILFWRLCQWLGPYWRQWRSQELLGGLRRGRQSRPPQNLTYWIQQADKLCRQQNYRGACRALYIALLQRLHESQVIPQQLSRTDQEYWQILQSQPKSAAYAILILTHERLCFSNRTITETDFRACQQAYRELG